MSELQEFGDHCSTDTQWRSVAGDADRDHREHGTLIPHVLVGIEPIRNGHPGLVTHTTNAVAGDDRDHPAPVTQNRPVQVIAELREQHRQRQDLHRAEKSLTLQIKAKCRRLCGGDKREAAVLYNAMLGKAEHPLAAVALAANVPFIEARAMIARNRKAVEKRLAQLAAPLPAAAWVDSVRGFGVGSLAAIVGECGDLSNYDGPAKLWKRMGLAVMTDGTRQRRIGGADALDHGYSPSRRSIMWNVAAAVFKAQSGEDPGPYRRLYDERKTHELGRVESAGHAHNRALRYVGKRLLRDLWNAWRTANQTL